MRMRFAGLMLLLFAGCGGQTESYAEVEGCVYFQGAPLPGGTIVFAPDPTRGGSGPLARAEIRADGHFSLRSGERDGAILGWHRISVASTPTRSIPRHYCDPELSGLCREVKSGTNTIELRLE